MLKNVLVCNLRIFVKRYCVSPWQPFQPSLFFEGKAEAYLNEAPFRCCQGPNTLGPKKFYNIGPLMGQNCNWSMDELKLTGLNLAQYYKTFFVRNLRIFVTKVECLSLGSIVGLF